MNLLFTIATVTYNAEATLERTLRSVALQNYAHIEHLIIDGNSKDRTIPIVANYIEENKTAHSIRLISEPDKGLYDAMNKALRNAAGQYIVFLNAGDCLNTLDVISSLALLANNRQSNSGALPAILYGDTHIVDDEGYFLRRRRLTPPEQLSVRSFLDGMLICHQSFYVRTDLAKQEFYDLRYRYSADYDWCVRLIKRATRENLSFVNSHLVLTDYLNEGMTTRNHRASLLERLRIMAKHYGWVATIVSHIWFVVRAIIKK